MSLQICYCRLTTCTEFEKNVTISKEAILIRCTEQHTKEKIYENVHTSIRITSNVQNKINLFDNITTKPLSVLFVGIDSISRLNFIRALPKTCKYVENNGWISLKGYNKIDDNTFPNLMAILTGWRWKVNRQFPKWCADFFQALTSLLLMRSANPKQWDFWTNVQCYGTNIETFPMLPLMPKMKPISALSILTKRVSTLRRS